jgi:UDP-glucose 4-epimerase
MPGEVYNVGGNEAASIWDILHHLEALSGRRIMVSLEPSRHGDQQATLADTSKLSDHLGWKPRVGLREGLARQVGMATGAAGGCAHRTVS